MSNSETDKIRTLPGCGRTDIDALLEMAKGWEATDVVVIGIRKEEGAIYTMIGSSCPEIIDVLAILELGRERFYEVRNPT